MRMVILYLAVLGSLAYADNFMLSSDDLGHVSPFGETNAHGDKHEPPTQKMMIEGVDPNSDLGKAISKYIAQSQKPPVKKKVAKKPAPKKTETAENYNKVLEEHKNGGATMDAVEVPAPSEHGKEAAVKNDKAGAKEEHGAPPPPPPAKDAHSPEGAGHSDIKNLLKPVGACG